MAIAFTLTETQSAIADTVNALLNDRYDFAARRALVEEGQGHSPDLWASLAELGLLGTEIEEAAGGIDGSFADTAVVLQAMGRAIVVAPFIPAVVLGAGLINMLGTPEQRAALLPEIVGGTMILALAHDEDVGGTPVTTATPTSEGWHVQGGKTLVLGGNVANQFIVSAVDGTDLRLFLIPADAPGVQRHAYLLYDENGAADLAIDTVVPESALLGTAQATRGAPETALDRGTAAAIHEAVGAMDRLCEMTPDYLKTRVQFGQPLARFQVLQHQMVEMGMALEQARSMAMLATAALDESDPAVRARDISAAKLMVGDAARLIGQTAVQLHGGIALTDEYPAGHYFKRITMIAHQFGDALYHLARYERFAA